MLAPSRAAVGWLVPTRQGSLQRCCRASPGWDDAREDPCQLTRPTMADTDELAKHSRAPGLLYESASRPGQRGEHRGDACEHPANPGHDERQSYERDRLRACRGGDCDGGHAEHEDPDGDPDEQGCVAETTDAPHDHRLLVPDLRQPYAVHGRKALHVKLLAVRPGQDVHLLLVQREQTRSACVD